MPVRYKAQHVEVEAGVMTDDNRRLCDQPAESKSLAHIFWAELHELYAASPVVPHCRPHRPGSAWLKNLHKKEQLYLNKQTVLNCKNRKLVNAVLNLPSTVNGEKANQTRFNHCDKITKGFNQSNQTVT